MTIDKRVCPWCGQEIAKPKLYLGVCDYCKKPYKLIVLTFTQNRFDKHPVYRQETLLLLKYMKDLLIILCMVTPIFIYVNEISSTSVPFLLILFIAAIHRLCQHKNVYLVKDGVGSTREDKGDRKIFLAEYNMDISIYYRSFIIEAKDPDSGACYNNRQITLNITDNLKNTVIVVDKTTPLIFNNPGWNLGCFSRVNTNAGELPCQPWMNFQISFRHIFIFLMPILN